MKQGQIHDGILKLVAVDAAALRLLGVFGSLHREGPRL
jgi:hypothetical protein